MKRLMIFAFLAWMPMMANAGYDAQITGNISMMESYPSGQIVIELTNQPSSHPACDASMFVVPESTAAHLRQAMLSALQDAQQNNTQVLIGYDSQGDCVRGKIRVYDVKPVTQ